MPDALQAWVGTSASLSIDFRSRRRRCVILGLLQLKAAHSPQPSSCSGLRPSLCVLGSLPAACKSCPGQAPRARSGSMPTISPWERAGGVRHPFSCQRPHSLGSAPDASRRWPCLTVFRPYPLPWIARAQDLSLVLPAETFQ